MDDVDYILVTSEDLEEWTIVVPISPPRPQQSQSAVVECTQNNSYKMALMREVHEVFGAPSLVA